MTKFTTAGVLATAVLGASFMTQTADAAVFRYFQSGDWTDIASSSSPNGWGLNPNTFSGSLPGDNDDARINFGGNTVDVTTAVPGVSRVQIGVDESGTVNVNSGGVLSTPLSSGTGDIFVGNNNSAATGTMNVNDGGEVNVGRILWVGNNGSTGELNINEGGVVNVDLHLWWGMSNGVTSTISIDGTLNQTVGNGNLGLGTIDGQDTGNTGGFALVNIGATGELNLANFGTGSIQDGSVLTIDEGGLMTVTLDRVGDIESLVSEGKIVGVGGDVIVDYDSTLDLTTVSVGVIPEPGSLLMLSAGGLGMLVRRRR